MLADALGMAAVWHPGIALAQCGPVSLPVPPGRIEEGCERWKQSSNLRRRLTCALNLAGGCAGSEMCSCSTPTWRARPPGGGG